MRLADLTLHAPHLVPRFPLHGHGTPDDWQVHARRVVADGAGIVFRRNPGPSVFGWKAEEEVVHLFCELSDSALTQKCVVPFVIDPPLLSELREHVNAV